MRSLRVNSVRNASTTSSLGSIARRSTTASTVGGISAAEISRLTAPLRMAIAVAPTALSSSSWISRGTSAWSGAPSTTAAVSAIASRSESHVMR